MRKPKYIIMMVVAVIFVCTSIFIVVASRNNRVTKNNEEFEKYTKESSRELELDSYTEASSAEKETVSEKDLYILSNFDKAVTNHTAGYEVYTDVDYSEIVSIGYGDNYREMTISEYFDFIKADEEEYTAREAIQGWNKIPSCDVALEDFEWLKSYKAVDSVCATICVIIEDIYGGQVDTEFIYDQNTMTSLEGEFSHTVVPSIDGSVSVSIYVDSGAGVYKGKITHNFVD